MIVGLALALLVSRDVGAAVDSAGSPVQSRAVAARFAAPTTRRLLLGLGSVGAVAVTGVLDRPLRDRVHLAGGPTGEWLSDVATPLGTPLVLAPGLLLWAASGYYGGHPERVRSSGEVVIAVSTAVVACEAVKLMVGRERPFESSNDADVFRPFSSHDSFPSGHTTFAFATAAAIAHEAPQRWVPWVAYPVAGAVGWSRMRDDRHWASDVLAGSLLGTWVARRTIDYIKVHPGVLQRLRLARG